MTSPNFPIDLLAGSQKSARRCKDKAYIILLGLSGAGKSTTMNVLFDRDGVEKPKSENPSDQTKESGPKSQRLLDLDGEDGSQSTESSDGGSKKLFTSQTQEVLEYKIVLPEGNEFCSKEMVVVDTPGFFDVNEDHKVKDSKIMATLELYLENNSDLKQCYPSAVLLIVDFSDVRIYDSNSYFVQFLKALDKLNDKQDLIDTDTFSCNFVLVLTHFMRAEHHRKTPSANQSSLQENPEPRVRFITGLIKTFTSISSNFPVVFAENKAKAYGLPVEMGYFKLLTGDMYPYNLFRAIENVAINCRDIAGQEVFTAAFRDPFSLSKLQTNSLALVNEKDFRYVEFMYILKEINLKLRETKSTMELDEIWWNLDRNETYGYEIFLYVLKATFIRSNIESDEDIPETPKEILSLLQQLPNNSAIEKVVRKIGIVPPPLWCFAKAVGSFYNIDTESLSDKSPFISSDSKITISGFEAPQHLQVELVTSMATKTLTVTKQYPTIDAYAASFWQNRGVEFLPEKERDSVSKWLDGHNLNTTWDEISGIKEFREYSIFVQNNYQIDPKYKEDISKMPGFSNRSKAVWEDHFRKYGSHVLQSAYLGGYIKVIGKRDKNVTEPASLIHAYQTIQNILDKAGSSDAFSEYEKRRGWTFEIKYFGGDTNVVKPSLSRLFSAAGSKKFRDWQESLQMNPVLLPSEQLLQHMSYYLKSDVKCAQVLSRAAMSLYGCTEFYDATLAVSRRDVGYRKCIIL